MQSGYFRVVRFIPEAEILQLSMVGLEDPNADIVYCEWTSAEDGFATCVVHHGDKRYVSPVYIASVIGAKVELATAGYLFD